MSYRHEEDKDEDMANVEDDEDMSSDESDDDDAASAAALADLDAKLLQVTLFSDRSVSCKSYKIISYVFFPWWVEQKVTAKSKSILLSTPNFI